jgi:phospholipid transport system transporter-binding protein
VPAAEAETTLVLPARVDAAAAAALFPVWAARSATLAAIDFSAVTSIDSAGVALVRALAAQARAGRGTPPRLLATPPRYAQLCLAHRVEPGDTSA